MKVCWVKIWIDSMATITERFRDDEGRVDFEALGREEYAFRHALITSDYSKSERARDLAEAAEKDYKIHSENGKKGGRPKKLTAAAATREGVDVSTTGCNHYDQEANKASTNSPDASVGNAEGVITNGSPITRNGSRVTGTSGTSGQTFDTAETLDKAGAGEVPPENISAKPSPALPVLSFGEFGNVKMTNIQYGKLCERFNYADSVIEEADQYFEAQPAKKKKYKNHYAMLLNWCKRRETESKPKQGYMTSDDISKKNYEESKARLEAMFSKGRKTA